MTKHEALARDCVRVWKRLGWDVEENLIRVLADSAASLEVAKRELANTRRRLTIERKNRTDLAVLIAADMRVA